MYSDEALEALEISYKHEEVRRITTTSMIVDINKYVVLRSAHALFNFN